MTGEAAMKRTVKQRAAVIACGLTMLMSSAGVTAAQKTATVHAVTRRMVPDNPSPHPAPDQPIPYSHKQHMALGLECKECHANPEPGKLLTIPDAEKCMQCHVTIAKDQPSIQKLTEYANSKQPIPWVRVYQVLPGIEWGHRAHLNAGVKCEMCHGQVRQMEKVSEVTSVTTMYACLHCHELNHAKTACETCHKH
jgi:Cytochrome c3